MDDITLRAGRLNDRALLEMVHLSIDSSLEDSSYQPWYSYNTLYNFTINFVPQ